MVTEFYLRVSTSFYLECSDVPAAGTADKNDDLGIVEVVDDWFGNQQDTPVYVYFSSLQKMMEFQLRYL
jgi:hypothetical protein